MTHDELTRTCEHCKNPLVPRPNENASKFKHRRFCSHACSARFYNNLGGISNGGNLGSLELSWEAARAKRAALLEDAEWIIGTDYPERVAQRLGYEKPESLIRSLARWGRNDLAAKLERAS